MSGKLRPGTAQNLDLHIYSFTPYNPESPGPQTGDEGNFKYKKDEGKPRPLGQGYTGFTSCLETSFLETPSRISLQIFSNIFPNGR